MAHATLQIWKEVEALHYEGLSPYAIAKRLQAEHGKPVISPRNIYYRLKNPPKIEEKGLAA